MTGPVPGAIYPDDPYSGPIARQSLPDNFVPPAFWGAYPSFGGNQTSHINTALPPPPPEDGPSYAPLGGQKVGLVNANPAAPIGV